MNIVQRRRHTLPLALLTVTSGTPRLKYWAARLRGIELERAAYPRDRDDRRNFVGADIEDVLHRIERGTGPLRAAPGARKDDRRLTLFERGEPAEIGVLDLLEH